MAPKSRKTCCCIAVVLIIVFIVACVTLFFTILKPRPPEIIPHYTRLRNATITYFPEPSLNAALNLTITVKNPNYGDCWYQNSTVQVFYHGSPVAELPLKHGVVPAREKRNIVAFTQLNGTKIMHERSFYADMSAGSLDFTALAKMAVKVRVLKIIKFPVKVIVSCQMSISVLSQPYYVVSACRSKLKI